MHPQHVHEAQAKKKPRCDDTAEYSSLTHTHIHVRHTLTQTHFKRKSKVSKHAEAQHSCKSSNVKRNNNKKSKKCFDMKFIVIVIDKQKVTTLPLMSKAK